MERKELLLKGAYLITPKVFKDNRGFFFESYQQEDYRSLGLPSFVQDNHSYSVHGVIRGMHFQSGEGQAKLVRAAIGKIYDVIVDLRPDSPTYKQWEGVILDDEQNQQLFIPTGFAHGFQVLSNEAHVFYKVSTPYQAELEKGFLFSDPDISIEWPIKNFIVSKRDQEAPLLRTLEGVFV